MLVLSGYRGEKSVHRGRACTIHAGLREQDGREVALKVYRGDDAAARAHAEHDVLRRVAGPGVVEALEVCRSQHGPVLALSWARGVSLRVWLESGPPILAQFLDMAIGLAEALAAVHGGRAIHLAVAPEHVIFDPDGATTHLVGFGHARSLGGGRGEASPRERQVGAVKPGPFIAPEQTGRMDRGVDSRSDLYSLGATLYFALTGCPPFETDDALGLVHAHMAIVPVAPAERRADVPVAVSNIVMRLLRKSPDDRYQTAHGVRVDLIQVREHLRRSGHVPPDMLLGTADVPHRPHFARRLHGRDREVAALNRAFARASGGEATCLMLSGGAGIGKSALVAALREPLAKAGGYLAVGKLEATAREAPYAAIAQALSDLTDQLLTESDERLGTWRTQLREALGSIARAILPLAPDIAMLIEDAPPIPLLGASEAAARLGLALQRAFGVIATAEHPLVLWLDDLHHADAATCELLRLAVLGSRDAALLVVGTLRDDVAPDAPIAIVLDAFAEAGFGVEALTIEPLTLDACTDMLAEALGRSAADAGQLATCVVRKTGASPRLVQDYIHHLYDIGLIRFGGSDGWIWDTGAIERENVPDDAAALMVAKLDRLGSDATEILDLAACVGGTFDIAALQRRWECEADRLESTLFSLADAGLLVPGERGFRFAHDRIQEAVLARMAPEARARAHHVASQRLLANTSPQALPSVVFEIAHHLAHGSEYLRAEEKQRALEVQTLAGKCALLAGSPVAASRYFDEAHRLFRDTGHAVGSDVGFDLYMQSIEAARQCQAFARARELLDALEREDLAVLRRAQLAAKRIAVAVLVEPIDRALDLVIEKLNEHGGGRWPREPSAWRTRLMLHVTARMLRGRLGVDSWPALAADQRERVISLTMIIGAGAAVIAAGSPSLNSLVLAHAMRLLRRHGHVASAQGVLLAGFATSRSGSGSVDAAELDEYSEAAASWNARYPDPGREARTAYLTYAFLQPLTGARVRVTDPLAHASERLCEVGDLEFGSYAAILRICYLVLTGAPLDAVAREQQAFQKKFGALRTLAAAIHERALRLLSDQALDEDELAREVAAIGAEIAAMPDSRFGAWSIWVLVLTLLSRFDAVLQASEAALSGTGGQGGRALYADIWLCRGIAASATSTSGRRDRSRAKRVVRAALRQVEALSVRCPDFCHMALALRAEIAHLELRDAAALAGLLRAAEQAMQQGYVHHAALLHERRASILAGLNRSAEVTTALRRAASHYQTWGAAAKAAALEGRAARVRTF